MCVEGLYRGGGREGEAVALPLGVCGRERGGVEGGKEGREGVDSDLTDGRSSLQYVVDSLQSVLEVAESPVLLKVLVKNISLVAKLCPQHLAHHFKVNVGSYKENCCMALRTTKLTLFVQSYCRDLVHTHPPQTKSPPLKNLPLTP